MKFGLMTQIQIPRPWGETSERHGYWNGLQQGVAGEAAGFEYFWITEQHFLAEIGHSTASDMFLAALSQTSSATAALNSAPGAAPVPISSTGSALKPRRAARSARRRWKPF